MTITLDESASPDPPIAEALLRKRSISGPKFDVWYQEPFLSETTFDTCQMKLAKSSIAVAPFKPSKNGYMPVVCVHEWEGAGTCVRVRLRECVCVCQWEKERESVKEETGGFFWRGFNRKGMKTKTGIGKEKIEREGNSFEQKELFLFLIFCCFLSNEFFSAPMNFFSPSFIPTFHFKILTPERKSTQARRRKKK